MSTSHRHLVDLPAGDDPTLEAWTRIAASAPPPDDPLWTFAADGRTATLRIYDFVGAPFIAAADVARGIDSHPRLEKIDVFINTPGGRASEGLAIYNALSRSRATVRTVAEGWAASAGSVILLAGDEIELAAGSLVMIHQASALAWGNASALAKQSQFLARLDGVLLDLYVARTGGNREELARWLREETWMTPAEAVARGFGHKMIEHKAPSARPRNADKVTNLYLHAPADAAATTQGTHAMTSDPNATNATAAATTPPAAPATPPAPPAAPVTPPTATTPPEATPAAATAQAPPAASAAPPANTAPAAGDALADERKRCAAIMAACQMAGFAHLASGFITAGTTIEAVNAHLLAAKCQANPPLAGDGGTQQPAGGQANDAATTARAEYRQAPDVFASMGVSEQQYVESRAITLEKDGVLPMPHRLQEAAAK